MKKRSLYVVVLGGLALGYTGASTLWPHQTRAEQIVELFQDYCLPPSSKHLEAKMKASLIRRDLFPKSTHWVDPASATILTRNARRCSIKTTAPSALTRQQAEELKARLDALVPDLFPSLRFDPKSTLGPETISTAWMQGGLASPDRWGVYAFSYPDWGENAGSILSFVRRPTSQ
ncbi:hypothetical protein TRM7557_00652 [Tritonibacter multivorans]|uniref:Uncharacterized protein n=1 Tax=Tritonibacter multivorans TaxID=928856 RepID=A0A0P1G2G5_9RHOB|nr:hypothetical protein [Tritonibacter multivorans]MDA7419687.1 hypothetical protein [Tritonibacter multivorans]CUH75980.1 hypothetical protein TRM7557_00652 [Tritonibacter multivorans]SFC57645.1 hypothetical protein SAMN04488049_103130 [Tritonibacter multivorans]